MNDRDLRRLAELVADALERRGLALPLRTSLEARSRPGSTEGDPQCHPPLRSESMDPTLTADAGDSSSPHPVATEMLDRLRREKKPSSSAQTSLRLSKAER